jgi:MYXO-CTERM domain-containing protein
LSHLFVSDLGNGANTTVLDQTGDTPEQIANLALFSHVLVGSYWSGTPDTTDPYDPDPRAWIFYTDMGLQNSVGAYVDGTAIAVRSGDVAAAVPEPQTLALALLALGAAAVARRRRAA